ncbi:outer membrane beta-barrel protein [Ichthyenterobacterium magnum]|uniref:Outer membrane protein beta-barrel domain-containing protein n=1 Tax=Ichthyenterobacterium magnum TaxID=1230530 RepID=A0A420DKK5_9FLAO|nr:outer membrane beta-barrel protein [Ichthyenterobacterium magnum]RKE94731.1 hypothetical protein BXY80_1742 [Ichthyenterobacterium magnum]
MKKLFLFAAVAVFGLTSMNAQGLKAGVSGGFISGDFSDGYSFNISVDVTNLWDVSEDFDAGVTAGYSHSIGKDNIDAAGFLPIAGAARYNISEEFTLGADLGYAVGISPDGNDGGFYYSPRLQYGVSDSIDIVAAYRGVSVDGGTFNTITFGVEFGI